jgi:inosine/xanthosine triphosphate pyrophosphatase family protein/dephospho-CoA kinase
MTQGPRIVPKPSFLNAERRPLVYFVTTSSDKMLQARIIFSKFGLDLLQFSEAHEYVEDYSQSKYKLLEVGLREVVRATGGSSFVFVEDTSVRIEAISTPDTDKPGVAIKDWFSEGRMLDLSRQIHDNGQDPRATVRSDVALHVPGLARPVFFSGETTGTIAESPPIFQQDPQYPWLRPDTFNGWLIPDGTTRRLGEMDFEEALAFDFRAKALRELIERLEEYTATLNVPPQSYALRPRQIDQQGQLPLTHPPALLVIGHTCAGKTTLGETAALTAGLRHIEASLVMRTLPLPDDSQLSLSAFARANALMLKNGYDVVAQQILSLYGSELNGPFVITGLRTLPELTTLRRAVPWSRVILVDASEPTRYERYLRRARPDDDLSLERFRERDSEHEFFGLLGVADHVADTKIRNEGPIQQYFAQIDAVIRGTRARSIRGTHPGVSLETVQRSQLFRVLSVLGAGDDPELEFAAPAEIERRTKDRGAGVGRSSVRKVLTEYQSLIRRIAGQDGTARFALSEAGRAYLDLVNERINPGLPQQERSTTPTSRATRSVPGV